ALEGPSTLACWPGALDCNAIDSNRCGRPVGGQTQFIAAGLWHSGIAALDRADLDAQSVKILSGGLRGLDWRACKDAALVVDRDAGVLIDRVAGSSPGCKRPNVHDQRVHWLFAGVAHGRLHGDNGPGAQVD